MEKHVIDGFYADRDDLDMEKYLVFDYYFESTTDPHETAAHLCQEQSTAQWRRVDVDEDLRVEFGAKVIDLQVERVLEVHDRPIFFGVIKPNIGLSPEPFAELAFQGWLGGLDIAKDDEMLCDVPWSPLEKRARLLGRARRESERITGRKKIYLANITDEVDTLIELHDVAVSCGANAVMVNGMTTGLSAVRMLRKHTKVPIVGHFDFMAPLTRAPYHGLHLQLLAVLQRLVGFDAIIMPGFGSRMKTFDDEVLRYVDACFKPLGHMKRTLPVPAGSQWAGSTAMLYEKLGTIDFGIVPGRAVFGHPSGPKAGAASLVQGWNAVEAGISLNQHAETHEELREAIEAFGV